MGREKEGVDAWSVDDARVAWGFAREDAVAHAEGDAAFFAEDAVVVAACRSGGLEGCIERFDGVGVDAFESVDVTRRQLQGAPVGRRADAVPVGLDDFPAVPKSRCAVDDLGEILARKPCRAEIAREILLEPFGEYVAVLWTRRLDEKVFVRVDDGQIINV